MKNKVIYFLVFLLSVNVLLAQRNYAKGIVYLTEHDSVRGLIKNNFLIARYKKIKFIGSNGKKQKLKAYKLHGYKIDGGKKFLRTPYNRRGGNSMLLEVVVEGPLTVLTVTYTLRTTSFNNTFTNSSNFVSSTNSVNGMEFTRSTNTFTDYFLKNEKLDLPFKKVSPRKFKKFITNYVKDNKEVKEMVESKWSKYENLFEIVKLYNSKTNTPSN